MAEADRVARLRKLHVAIGRAFAMLVLIVLFGGCLGLLPNIDEAAHEEHHIARCANNLHRISTACRTWATQHLQRWPDMYSHREGARSDSWWQVGRTRNDYYDPVTPAKEPDANEQAGDNSRMINSNTSSFWLLVAQRIVEPAVFVCPASTHIREDQFLDPELYRDVRDFRGENFVSYSYQNVLGPYSLKETAPNASTLAVVADANPMRRDFWSGGPDGGKKNGATDQKLAEKPKFVHSDQTQRSNKRTDYLKNPWELNSPNHNFRGQNVLYLDGHVEWKVHPYCGPKWDNIWLRRKAGVEVKIDPSNIETLRDYNDETSYDGKSILPSLASDDSFLVP